MTMKFTFGCDPEFVLMKGNAPQNAADILPNEANAYKDVYHDNVMAEFQVTPASEKEEAVEAIRKQFRVLEGIMTPRNITIRCVAGEDYTRDQLDRWDTRQPTSVPEKCAYKMVTIEPPAGDFAYRPERTAGGHIHIGMEPLDPVEHTFMARLLDLFVGVPAAYLNFDKKWAVTRCHLWYGKPGRYRETDYGIEYRTLSNFWLASPKLVELIYELTEFTVEFYEGGGYFKLWSYDYQAPEDAPVEKIHICNAYNVTELWIALQAMSRDRLDKFMPILDHYLPRPLYQRICDYSLRRHYNPYAEWSL